MSGTSYDRGFYTPVSGVYDVELGASRETSRSRPLKGVFTGAAIMTLAALGAAIFVTQHPVAQEGGVDDAVSSEVHLDLGAPEQ